MANAVTGLILAGGEGRRVGGADKGLLDFQGRPLIAHVIERLAPQVDRLLISANRNLDAYRAFGHPVLTDLSDERLGPLAGIQAGLAACDTPWMMVCPCDCPQLPDDLVLRLMSAIELQGAALAVATTSTGMQPAFQLCRRELLPALEKTLAAGERKVGAWCRDQGAVAVTFPDPDAFRNMNTPAELAFRPI
ncbi:MAG: molybdenum cofactor guanylyltransferase MobA [Rhodocyclaceae bacterium]|nr:molybdenum cofactor guanylyltransferase MobA [Rhodocyclaceae bacterium]